MHKKLTLKFSYGDICALEVPTQAAETEFKIREDPDGQVSLVLNEHTLLIGPNGLRLDIHFKEESKNVQAK